MNEYANALRKRQMWFGSYTRAGELRKVRVWCFLHQGSLEFLTDGQSFKAKRARRNPQVVCRLGAEDGPELRGTAEIVEDRAEVWRGYHRYWRDHPGMMLLLSLIIRSRIASGRQIMIRVHPAEPSPLLGVET